jgi:peptidoglycan/LPS O-acetylase OafA/YrhL
VQELTAEWLWRVIGTLRMLGPDIFIMVSGFLLGRSLARRDEPLPAIIGRRAHRIFPLYLGILAAYLLSSFFVRPESHMPSDAVATAVYVLHNALLIPLAFGVEPIISAAWTIGVLMVLYIAFSAVARMLGIEQWTPQQRGLACTAGSAVLTLVPTSAVVDGAALFLAGAAAREIGDILPSSRRTVLALFAVGLAAFLLRSHELLSPGQRLIIRIAAIAPLLICIGRGRAPLIQPLLDDRALAAFGRMSYSHYLLHSGILVTMRASLFPLAAGLTPAWALVPSLLVLTFGASIAGSAALYRWVELPLRASRSSVRAISRCHTDSGSESNTIFASPGMTCQARAVSSRSSCPGDQPQ